MKVLVCIPCLLTGGTEIQTLSLVEALVVAGHRPVVVCYFEYDKAMVECYRAVGAEVKLLSAEGGRPVGLNATIKHIWQGLRRVVKLERPDIAHVQYMAPGALPIIILKSLGIKNILATSHTDGDIYSPNGLRVIRFLTNNVLTAFQCITERAEKSYFGSSRLFDGNLTRHFTIYNNIPSHINISQKSRPPKEADSVITIGVVSRLESIKGTDLVIPAFIQAAEKNPQIHLLIVGDGSQREFMERQTKEADVTARVTFVGRKPQSSLQAYYDQIDILMMPSRSEGFGLTAVEGMARGCVPVVAKIGGLPEVVTSNCGLLHEPENTKDIANKIHQAIQNFDSLSYHAIKRAHNFSVDRYNNQIIELYSQL